MLTKLTTIVLALAAGTAGAATVEPTSATREDAQRIWYHDQELRIAEQDYSAATLRVMTTKEKWDDAVKHKHLDDAGKYAVLHLHALQARNDAFGRVQLHRAEHEIALQDFQRDANWVRAEARLSTRKRG